MDNPEYREIRENMLGWDITDFGSGDYKKIGLFLFTVRNGNYYNNTYKKPYAEKIMIADEGQITPYHYHSNKMEDIINRGGGNLLIKLYNSTPEGKLSDTPVTVNSDGRSYTADAGSVIRLTPGESITLYRGLYHQFWGEEGKGRVLVGEVSMVNDDRTDNHFLNPVGRFPAIEEDEQPLYLLGQDYAV
jgi:D-lyxose ketol-isomerase